MVEHNRVLAFLSESITIPFNDTADFAVIPASSRNTLEARGLCNRSRLRARLRNTTFIVAESARNREPTETGAGHYGAEVFCQPLMARK